MMNGLELGGSVYIFAYEIPPLCVCSSCPLSLIVSSYFHSSLHVRERIDDSRVVVVERCFVFDFIPDGIDPLHGFVAEGPASDRVQCLLQLFDTAGADNEGVAVLILQWRVVRDPSISQIGSRDLCDECQ